jgi:hypothetical protein
MIIAVDDPCFTFFIGLCMLRYTRISDVLPSLFLKHFIRNRRAFLIMSDADNIPEIMAGMNIKVDDHLKLKFAEFIFISVFIEYRMRLRLISWFSLLLNYIERLQGLKREALISVIVEGCHY